jgi:hypothetical protein
MTVQQDDPFDGRAPSEAQLAECLRLTLRGFSKQELTASAERACKLHFGECAWQIDEATCIPCMGTLGGRVRLYEAHFVATGVTEH